MSSNPTFQRVKLISLFAETVQEQTRSLAAHYSEHLTDLVWILSCQLHFASESFNLLYIWNWKLWLSHASGYRERLWAQGVLWFVLWLCNPEELVAVVPCFS